MTEIREELHARLEEIARRNEWKKGLCDYCKGLDTLDVDNADFLLSEIARLAEQLRVSKENKTRYMASFAETNEHNTRLQAELQTEQEEVLRLQHWVQDLQRGMYINCVYCGHRYGPNSEVPASMADVLKEHIEQCPKHPMSKLKQEIADLKEQIRLLNVTISEDDIIVADLNRKIAEKHIERGKEIKGN